MEYKVGGVVVAKVIEDTFSPTEGMARYYMSIKVEDVTTQIACDAMTKGYVKKLAELVISSHYPRGRLVLIEKLGSPTKYYQK